MLAASAIFAFAGIRRQDNEEVIDFADLQGFRTELRDAGPRIRCFDLRQLSSFLTPEEQFYTFHQTQAAPVNVADWRLRIGGFVAPPKELKHDELKHRSDKTESNATH